MVRIDHPGICCQAYGKGLLLEMPLPQCQDVHGNDPPVGENIRKPESHLLSASLASRHSIVIGFRRY